MRSNDIPTPSTMEEAVTLKLDLVERIHSIEAQLAERAAKVAGRLVSNEEYREYMEWKGRACRAKASIVSRLSRLKVEIQRLRQQEVRQRVALSGGEVGLLKDLYKLTKSLVAAGADIDHEEQSLLDTVGAHLNGD